MMRLDAGGTTYRVSGSWSEMAELVSLDVKFPFEELPEDSLVRLYEQGRWWDQHGRSWGRPGVMRQREMSVCGGLPYIVYQQFSEVAVRSGHAGTSLRSYLEGHGDEHRGRERVFLDALGGLFAGGARFEVSDCRATCDRLASMITHERIFRSRLPPSLLAVASRAYESCRGLFCGASPSRRGSRYTGTVYRVVGSGRVFVLSIREPAVLRRAGIKLRRELQVSCGGGGFFSDLLHLWSSSEVLYGPGEVVAAYYSDGGYLRNPEALLSYLADPQREVSDVRGESRSGKFIVVRDMPRDGEEDGGDEVMHRIRSCAS